MAGGRTVNDCHQRSNWWGEVPLGRGHIVMGYLRLWSTVGETGDKERTSTPGLLCSDVISGTERK